MVARVRTPNHAGGVGIGGNPGSDRIDSQRRAESGAGSGAPEFGESQIVGGMRLADAFQFRGSDQRSLRYNKSRIASRRAALASRDVLRSSASMRRWLVEPVVSGMLHAGQRSAKPGLLGFSSNSSSQTLQILIGKAIRVS